MFSFSFADWNGRAFEWKSSVGTTVRFMSKTLFALGYFALVAALAEPTVLEKEKLFMSRGADVVFVVDTSPSMAALDIAGASRLQAAKQAISLLARENKGISYGLVACASQAALLVPPTLDQKTFFERLAAMSVGEMGDGSALGVGISTAVYHLESSAAPVKIIVLLTDGENNAGAVHPNTAAALAKDNGILLYIAGIGTKGSVPIEYTDPASGKIYSGYFQIPGGGISLCEHFECRPKSHVLTNLPNNIYETCGSVFWIDLNHRFLQLWPTKERYASEIEKSLYNVVFAAQGENGCIRYFNQVNDAKYPAMCYNTCCEIQATALYGMLPQYVYSVAPDGVFVNLFSASDIDFKVKDQPVKLTMKTQFPYSNQVALRVSADRPVTMKVRVRIPEWAKGGVVLRVNDRKVKTGMPGSYVEIDRTWKDNDEITWSLPMTWSYEKYIGATRIAGATRYAFFYGPMLMALQGPMMKDAEQAPNEPSVKFDVSPDEFLKRIKATDKPCEFTVEGMPDYRFTPYFSLQGGNFTCFPGLRQAE